MEKDIREEEGMIEANIPKLRTSPTIVTAINTVIKQKIQMGFIMHSVTRAEGCDSYVIEHRKKVDYDIARDNQKVFDGAMDCNSL